MPLPQPVRRPRAPPLLPCELVISRHTEPPPAWMTGWLAHTNRTQMLHTVYTQGAATAPPLPGGLHLHEEPLLSNVGREAYVYLAHLYQQGVRATQTVFCQIDVHKLGVPPFDFGATVDAICDPTHPRHGAAFTWIWSGRANLSVTLGMRQEGYIYTRSEPRGKGNHTRRSDWVPSLAEWEAWHGRHFGKPLDLLAPFAPEACFAVHARHAQQMLHAAAPPHQTKRLRKLLGELASSNAPPEIFMIERSWPQVFGLQPEQVTAFACTDGSTCAVQHMRRARRPQRWGFPTRHAYQDRTGQG